ncbi:MAG: phosphatase [Spirochaetes bacterium]|nr:phosphatase [Spirochaetota bacterium]
MKIELDIHTHTIASGHAYNTLDELVQSAVRAGLKVIAMTDHSPGMPGGAHLYHFYNLRILPEFINGVRVLKGAEVNIIDTDGNLDLDLEVLQELEMVIASLHIACLKPINRQSHTKILQKVMENPYVHVIGHLGDQRYDFDIEAVIHQAKQTDTLIEVNNSSLKPYSFRPGGSEMISRILKECARVGAKVVLGSDAHYQNQVGRFEESLLLLKEIDFPADLIIKNGEELSSFIEKKKKGLIVLKD